MFPERVGTKGEAGGEEGGGEASEARSNDARLRRRPRNPQVACPYQHSLRAHVCIDF